MFSGIVEDLGSVESLKRSEKGAVVTFRAHLPTVKIHLGDSIAVNGACLTVVAKRRGAVTMEVSAETLRRTTLGTLKAGDPVNLERSLTLGKLLGGHLVAGHVDGVGRVVAIEPEGDSRLCSFEVAASEARYLIEKGSVAVDGISLTVFAIRGRRFSVAIIPHTLRMTTLGHKRIGSLVNIESDLLGKYVERLLSTRVANRARALVDITGGGSKGPASSAEEVRA